MHFHHFDTWTRTIGLATSRRGVLKVFATGMVAGLAGRLGGGQLHGAMAASANCNQRQQCIQGAQQALQRDQARCRAGPSDEIGECMQDAEQDFQDLLDQCQSAPSRGCEEQFYCCPSDGECKPPCAPSQTRINCDCQCPRGQVECSGDCYDPCRPGQSRTPNCTCQCQDSSHACANDLGCLDPATCTGGRIADVNSCRCICRPGQELCRDTCYPPCPPGRIHDTLHTCDCVCPAPTQPCFNGGCIDPSTCTGGRLADYSQCECVCDQGQAFCNGTCIDVQSNATNCGTCGHSCDEGKLCVEGVCTCAPISCAVSGQTQNPRTCLCECPSGTTACTNGCVNLQNNNSNCGSCGYPCQPGEQCVDWLCQCPILDHIQCPAGCFTLGGTDPTAVCCACPYPGGLCTYACCDAVRLEQGMTCQCVDGGVRADCVKLP
jgi:hypothetical protein